MFVVDSHTHSLACGHAYSTVTENARAAKEKGLSAIAFTEHAPKLPFAPSDIFFRNLDVLPKFIEGVRVYRGVELNILAGGEVDLKASVFEDGELEVTIASLHTPCYPPNTDVKKNTAAVIGAIKNPNVKIIGHLGDPRYPIYEEEIVRAAVSYGTLIELNNASFNPKSRRFGAEVCMQKLFLSCAEKEQPIVLGSDSHYCQNVGNFDKSLEFLGRIHFPRHLIINTSVEMYEKVLCIK
ncbi:putative phosphatase [Clostridia bacterium]|nr:putative phosphatase [Clostridia bacterium]